MSAPKRAAYALPSSPRHTALSSATLRRAARRTPVVLVMATAVTTVSQLPYAFWPCCAAAAQTTATVSARSSGVIASVVSL